jgi:hypothetical protein
VAEILRRGIAGDIDPLPNSHLAVENT